MAHEDGRNAVAARWHSKVRQPFVEEWGREVVWWAPPTHLGRVVGRFLRKKAKENKAGKPVLLIPAEEWVRGGEGWNGWRIAWEYPPGTRLWRPVRGFPPPREDEMMTKEKWVVVTTTKA